MRKSRRYKAPGVGTIALGFLLIAAINLAMLAAVVAVIVLVVKALT